MKDKKNIILMVVAIAIFLIAIVFFIWSLNFEVEKNNIIENNIPNTLDLNKKDESVNTTIDNNPELQNLVDEINNKIENGTSDETSNTEDIGEVGYTDIKVYDEDNTETSLYEFENSSVMLLFWNPENEDSVEVLRKVNEIYKKYENKVKFMMVSTSKDIPDELKNEISMNIYYDLNNEYESKYNISTLPAMIYVYKDNTIMNAKSGVPSTDALEANLDILADNI